jgi:dihydrofolate synthase / folylpolyglutamate synthase
MRYAEVLAHLDGLQMHKIKLGLAAMRDFLDRVGHPEEALRFVHVAGTNGKGSVCAALAEILHRAGYRVGVFTSPHLSSVRERFRIGPTPISEEEFARLGAQIITVLGPERITYFEFTTALALLWFAEAGVDLVVLETGMGGRLDATNVVHPEVAVITSISMDHEAYLGNTLAQIAGEKAGIIKNRVPVVSGGIHPEAAEVIAARAREVDAPLFVLGQDFDYQRRPDGTWCWQGGTGLAGRDISGLRSSRPSLAQQENDSLALATLALLARRGFAIAPDHIRQGLASVAWPGRMEYFEQHAARQGEGIDNGGMVQRFLLDGAHNPAGVKNLAESLRENFRYRRLIAVWGSMIDKDLATTLGYIVPLVDLLVITQPDGERAATPAQVREFLAEADRSRARLCPDVAEALAIARSNAGSEDLILVSGSLYLLGAVRAMLLGELV